MELFNTEQLIALRRRKFVGAMIHRLKREALIFDV